MNFIEAAKIAMQGHRVKRQTWVNNEFLFADKYDGEFVINPTDDLVLFFHIRGENYDYLARSSVEQIVALQKDLFAEDWCVVEFDDSNTKKEAH